MRAHITLVTAILLPLAGPALPAQADTDLVVVWSDTTRFNPDLEHYTFHVEDSGPGELRARWGLGEFVTIPHSGDVVLPVPDDHPDGPAQIHLFRCDPSCDVYLGASPMLEIRRRLAVFGGLGSGAFGPAGPESGNYNAVPQDVPVQLDWTLADIAAPTSVLAQGTHLLEPQSTLVPFEGIPLLPTGRYQLDFSAEVDHPDFGHLVGETTTLFNIDADATVRFTRSKPLDVYPVQDGYLDRLLLGVTGPEDLRGGRLAVVDAGGATVFFEDLGYWTWGDPLIFDGRDGSTPLPPGTYYLVFSGRDSVGNPASATSPAIVVHPEEMKRLTVRRTFKASKLVTSKRVGSCSTLRKPASRGWRGSLGYFSQTRCRRSADSLVATVNGVRLPVLHSDESYYGRLSVTMFGGAAKGASAAYINSGFFDAKKDVIRNLRTFRGQLGPHLLTAKYTFDHVRSPDDSPTVFWLLALTDGSRYDVKNFTVELRYVDLVMPSTQRVAAAPHPLRPARESAAVDVPGPVV